MSIKQKIKNKYYKEKQLVTQALANGIFAAMFSFIVFCILYFPGKRTGRPLLDYDNEWSIVIVVVLIAIPLLVSLFSFVIFKIIAFQKKYKRNN